MDLADIGFKQGLDDREAIFYLLDLAEHSPEQVLQPGETISQNTYRQLLFRLLQQTPQIEANNQVIQELEKRANISREDYKQVLVEHIASGTPSSYLISNIIQITTISPSNLKELFKEYQTINGWMSGSTIGFVFNYLEEKGQPYSKQEKRQFWEAYISEVRRKEVFRGISLSDIRPFANHEVLKQADYQKFLKRYLQVGAPTIDLLEFLLEKSIDSPQEMANYLEAYLRKGQYNWKVIQALLDFAKQQQYSSLLFSEKLGLYFERDNLSYQEVLSFADRFGQHLDKAAIKTKILSLAQEGASISTRMVVDDGGQITGTSLEQVATRYNFTLAEIRDLFHQAMDHQAFDADSFKFVLNNAGLSSNEVNSLVREILFRAEDETRIQKWMLKDLLNYLESRQTANLYQDYLLEADHLQQDYYQSLRARLADDRQNLAEIEEKIKKQDPRYRFFDPSPAMEQARAETAGYVGRYLYYGQDPVDYSSAKDLLQDHGDFYYLNLAFQENKGRLDSNQVKKILNPDVYQQLLSLKAQAAEHAATGSTWFLSRREVLPQAFVLSHGTAQAYSRKRKGVARDDELIMPQKLVEVIVDQGKSIGIRGEKASIGAFFSASPVYGSADNGTMIYFFTDDLLAEHVSISTDPAGADGWVARDESSDLMVVVPNRVLFNAQAGEVLVSPDGSRIELSHQQMAEYLLNLRYLLEQNPDLESALKQAGLEYHQQNLPAIDQELATIHHNLKEMSYPEATILAVRDRYLSLALSSRKDEQLKYQGLRKIVLSLAEGEIEEDFKSVYDNFLVVWDQGLRERYEAGMTATELINLSRELILVQQRRAYLSALRTLNTQYGEVGVARQHIAQIRSAEKYGDVAVKDLGENLLASRTLFLDSRNHQELEDQLEITQEVAEYMADVKRSVLRTTFYRAVGAVDYKYLKTYQRFRDRIAVCGSGSVGREETVISSDLDYLILLDDTDLTESEMKDIKKMLYFVGLEVDEILKEDYKIRPDAGLANRSRQPIVPLSHIHNFEIELGAERQVVEPTEIIDAAAVDQGSQEIVDLFKAAYLKRAKELSVQEKLDSSQRYMEDKVQKFFSRFQSGYSQLLSRDQITDLKLQLQRIYQFKLQALLAAAYEQGKVQELPSATLEKINLLEQKEVITEEEAQLLAELHLSLFRIRYRADVLNSSLLLQLQGDVNDRAKIVAKFDARTLSSVEMSRLVKLFQKFNHMYLQDTE